MGQFGQFVMNHGMLWIALIVILLVIFINEWLIQRKRAKEITPAVAVNYINRDSAVVFDLRDLESFRNSHIINAIRVSAEDFSGKRMDKYKDSPLIFVCARGLQSATLAAQLKTQGFAQPMVLAGGIAAWQAENLPVVKGK